MILKGGPRSGSQKYIRFIRGHLARTDTNEVVSVVQVRGTVASDHHGWFDEIAACARGSSGARALYHLAMSPHPDDRAWSLEEQLRAVDTTEEGLNLSEQPRLIVRHQKDGRNHLHVIWSRLDTETMLLRRQPSNYRQHEATARVLEAEFGLQRVQGAFDRTGPRPQRTISDAELRQGERTGIHPRDARTLVAIVHQKTGNLAGFVRAMADQDWVLARGDRGGAVLVDPVGGAHSLARLRPSLAVEAKAHMTDQDIGRLPGVGEVRLRRRTDANRPAALEAPERETLREEPTPPSKPRLSRGTPGVATAIHDLSEVKFHDMGIVRPLLDPFAAANYFSAAAQATPATIKKGETPPARTPFDAMGGPPKSAKHSVVSPPKAALLKPSPKPEMDQGRPSHAVQPTPPPDEHEASTPSPTSSLPSLIHDAGGALRRLADKTVEQIGPTLSLAQRGIDRAAEIIKAELDEHARNRKAKQDAIQREEIIARETTRLLALHPSTPAYEHVWMAEMIADAKDDPAMMKQLRNAVSVPIRLTSATPLRSTTKEPDGGIAPALRKPGLGVGGKSTARRVAPKASSRGPEID